MNHSLWGFPFGITLLHPIFHWNYIRCCYSDMRLILSAWRRRLVAQYPWLVFRLYFWLSSLVTRHGTFLYSLPLRIFTFFYPCPGLYFGCRWFPCFVPQLGLYQWDLCVYVGEMSLMIFFFVRWMTICLCFVWYFSNDAAFKFDIVAVDLSVCVIGVGWEGLGFVGVYFSYCSGWPF